MRAANWEWVGSRWGAIHWVDLNALINPNAPGAPLSAQYGRDILYGEAVETKYHVKSAGYWHLQLKLYGQTSRGQDTVQKNLRRNTWGSKIRGEVVVMHRKFDHRVGVTRTARLSLSNWMKKALSDIRLALSQRQPPGHGRFGNKLCAATGVRRTQKRAGRPAGKSD